MGLFERQFDQCEGCINRECDPGQCKGCVDGARFESVDDIEALTYAEFIDLVKDSQ